MSATAHTVFLFCLCCLVTGERSPPAIGLYFQLNGTIYNPGEKVLITDIGNEGYNRSDPSSSLVCVTINVNRNCCRTPDGGRGGNWFYPNGNIVNPRFYNDSFYRKFYRHQVRLIRIRGDIEPLGSYTCNVSDYQGRYFIASIRIGLDINITLTLSLDVVMAGKSVTFNCFIYSSDISRKWDFILTSPQNQKWSSSMPGVVVNDSQDTVRLYTISPVRNSHAGLYSCEVGSEIAVKTLRVKLQSPLSVVMLPLVQPVYATSSRNVSCYVQIQDSTGINLYLNVTLIPPSNSSQSVEIRQVTVAGRNIIENMFTLKRLRLSDSGKYSCSVQVYSENKYLIESDFSKESIEVNVAAVPDIEVDVSTSYRPISGTIHILTCSHRSSDPNFDYLSTYEWCHNGAVLTGQTFRVLVLPSLSLSHVGNYTCKVKATSMSVDTTVYATSSVHEIILPAPSPSVGLTVTPDIIFRGTFPQFTCTATYSQTISISIGIVMELRGPANVEIKQDAINFTSIFSIPYVSNRHSGRYYCTANTQGDFLYPSSAVTSDSIYISIVGPPSTPTIYNIATFPTNISFSWRSTSDVIQYYYLFYSYTIKSCHSYTGSGSFTISADRRNVTISTHEHGEYSTYFYAVNTAGRSTPATFVKSTPSTTPASGPANLTASLIGKTSITITWDSVLCLDRNTNITGYGIDSVSFFGISGYNVDISQQNLNVTHLFPGTLYTFRVFPLYRLDGVNVRGVNSSNIEIQTLLSKKLGFLTSRSSLLANNSVLHPNRVISGLVCITNSLDCCTPPFSSQIKGKWLLPNESSVLSHNNPGQLYQRRHSSSIQLFRTSYFQVYPEGVFTCSIPNSEGIIQNLFILLSPNISNLAITNLVYSRRMKTLTCRSTGRPVNSYQWLKDGKTIEISKSAYIQTQVISNRTSATYQQTLFSVSNSNFQGTFTCIVRDTYNNAVRKSVMLNNCPPGQYGAIAFDGSTVCVQCPANSMSVSEGSNECGCLKGYYRNNLEDANFPCTKPPSKCRDLRVGTVSGSSATLHWIRPTILGRHDLYYNVFLSTNSNSPSSFTRQNGYPIASDSATVEYTMSNLRPLTHYMVKVSANNGVSGSSGESEMTCEVSLTTTG